MDTSFVDNSQEDLVIGLILGFALIAGLKGLELVRAHQKHSKRTRIAKARKIHPQATQNKPALIQKTPEKPKGIK